MFKHDKIERRSHDRVLAVWIGPIGANQKRSNTNDVTIHFHML